MAYVEVGNEKGSTGGSHSSPIQKWNSTGQIVEGIYKGQREGKFGPLMIVETSAGEVVYGVKAVLKRKLEHAKPGDKIKVEYLGKRKSQSGTEYGDFRVLVDSDQGNQSAPTPGNSVEFDRLVGLIRKDKGDGIANALAAAAKMAGDPVTSLREAMAQIGVVSF